MAIAAESGRKGKWEITGDRRMSFILGFQVWGCRAYASRRGDEEYKNLRASEAEQS
ncbi:hypothetical protein ACFY89_15395 [Achromobacter spanius]|uniref:hypothetical protein n=1 Tax=Achromobacter spanius TaxID=217203 RepID=UPI0036ED1926